MTRDFLSRPLSVVKDDAPVFRTELEAAHERIEQLQAALNDCRVYLENQMDVIDGPHNAPLPNRAMQLVNLIDEALSEEVKS